MTFKKRARRLGFGLLVFCFCLLIQLVIRIHDTDIFLRQSYQPVIRKSLLKRSLRRFFTHAIILTFLCDNVANTGKGLEGFRA